MRARKLVVANPRRLVRVRGEGSQVAGYLASYILPLLVVADPSWRDLAAYGGFLAVFCVVSVRAHLLEVNPLLYLYGYRLFSGQDEGTGESVYLLHQGGESLFDGAYMVSDVSANLLLVQPTEV